MQSLVGLPATCHRDHRASAEYQRRRPETTVLYEIVRDNLETLCGAIDDGAIDVKLPASAASITSAALSTGGLCNRRSRATSGRDTKCRTPRALRSLGVKLRRVEVILDEIDVIEASVRALASAHDWLFTSGGVGPTHDDLTIEGDREGVSAPVVVSPELDAMIRRWEGRSSASSD